MVYATSTQELGNGCYARLLAWQRMITAKTQGRLYFFLIDKPDSRESTLRLEWLPWCNSDTCSEHNTVGHNFHSKFSFSIDRLTGAVIVHTGSANTNDAGLGMIIPSPPVAQFKC